MPKKKSRMLIGSLKTGTFWTKMQSYFKNIAESITKGFKQVEEKANERSIRTESAADERHKSSKRLTIGLSIAGIIIGIIIAALFYNLGERRYEVDIRRSQIEEATRIDETRLISDSLSMPLLPEETPALDSIVRPAIAQNPYPPNIIPSKASIEAMYSDYYARRNARNDSILEETKSQYPEIFDEFKRAYDLYRLPSKTRVDLEEAKSIFTSLLHQEYEFYRLYYSLGLTYAYLGDHDSARKYYLDAEPYEKKLKTRDPSLYNSIGWEYLARDKPDSAFKYFADALDLDSQHPLAWAGLLKIQRRNPKKYAYPR